MIYFSNKYRSTESEILDDFELKGSEMEAMLTDLDRVNKLLGGHQVKLSGIENLLHEVDKDQIITIVDIGCGDGAILRKVAQWGNRNNWKLSLIGIDANPHILREAQQRSIKFQNISFVEKSVFSTTPLVEAYDIALCTLFLHHFDNERVTKILEKLSQEAKVGVVVNDLQRNRLAFWLFRLFSSIFIKTRIARHDGLVSVARGFKRNELASIAKKIITSEHNIHLKWAFRWQWVLKSKRLDSSRKN